MAFKNPNRIIDGLTKESTSLIDQINKNTSYIELMQKFKDNVISPDEEDLLEEYNEKLEALRDMEKADDEIKAAQYISSSFNPNSPELKTLKQKIDNGEADETERYKYYRPFYRKTIADTLLENLGRK